MAAGTVARFIGRKRRVRTEVLLQADTRPNEQDPRGNSTRRVFLPLLRRQRVSTTELIDGLPDAPVRFIVRPAWARSWRWKSSRELTTANEAKRNCVRVTERGEEAWSETASRGTRTASEAALTRANRQWTAKLSWSRVRRRKCGDCAGRDRVLTWGDLALCLKGRR